MPAEIPTLAGGAFLLETAEDVFTPEDFSEEHRQALATADRFVTEEVLPIAERYEEKEEGLSRKLLEQCGELGLLSILAPERYGGLELDLTSQLVVAEALGRYESFSVTYGAHSGIGSLPLVFFGTDEQKQHYLPAMATGERMGAYCLSEPHAGSDALAARTKATLTGDGKHYVLSGQKMWISNGGWADLYTVFAKVDGEEFTAFLVERAFEGVRPGAEERKMGIHGSSTTALYLDDVKVPVENVLGEIGRGHIIAFNILNIGRLKLGASCVGGCKEVLTASIAYAQERKAFGKSLADFGAIQHKLAEMAIQTYVAESVSYRIGGLIDQKLADVSWDDADASKQVLGGIEEYAIECAIAKVVGSEALDFVSDEGVQIHGGYGFHHDYAVERAYRDSRINRIFEGTNEINRLLSVGMLLKRAAQNRLPLMPAVMQLIPQLSSGESMESQPAEGPLGAEARDGRAGEEGGAADGRAGLSALRRGARAGAGSQHGDRRHPAAHLWRRVGRAARPQARRRGQGRAGRRDGAGLHTRRSAQDRHPRLDRSRRLRQWAEARAVLRRAAAADTRAAFRLGRRAPRDRRQAAQRGQVRCLTASA